MKQLQTFLISAPLMVCAAMSAQAAEIKVIANSNVAAAAISSEELKRIFLITKGSFDDGSHAEPVLEKGGASHDAFVKEYLGKTDSALQIYYRSLVFTGKASMPKTFGSDAEVVAYVAKTKGAIGYVSASANAGGVKTLEVK